MSNSLLTKLQSLIIADPLRMEILAFVRELQLPDSWVAAGFVRNLVWDYLHGLTTSLSDIDVIYFCPKTTCRSRDLDLENQLKQMNSALPWSVKNQARMHIKNGDAPYKNSLDAMNYWPEQQTAVAVSLNRLGQVDVISSYGLKGLFSKKITYNPLREKTIFNQRVHRKEWLSRWPEPTLEFSIEEECEL